MRPARARRFSITACLLFASATVAPGASNAATASPAPTGDITIYRCVGPNHAITLQDHPCPKDVHQDVLQMVRPIDAPPRPQPVATVVPPPVEVRVVHERESQPLYECTNAETGETYLSQTGAPQSRYVTYWSSGFGDDLTPVGPRPPLSHPALTQPLLSPTPKPHPIARPMHSRFAFPAAVYVTDTCVRLSQQETCARMSERNNALGTLIFNGQANDRVRYEREQKALREQMREECNAAY